MKTVSNAMDKARDQIVRAVRQQSVESQGQRAQLTFPRRYCPVLTEATWCDVNETLPVGWVVEELTAVTFTVSVKDRVAA